MLRETETKEPEKDVKEFHKTFVTIKKYMYLTSINDRKRMLKLMIIWNASQVGFYQCLQLRDKEELVNSANPG